MSIKFKIGSLIAFLLFATISNIYFIFMLEREGVERAFWVNHTNNVIVESERLLGYFRDAETGQRGYLLTKNPAYLAPYHSALIRITDTYHDLTDLTEDDPQQQILLIELQESMDKKLADLKETIELTRTGNFDRALAIVVDDQGKYHMENIRANIGEFINNEKVLLEKRKGEYNENRAQITTLISVELVFFIGLAVFIYSFIKKNLFVPLEALTQSAERIKKGQRASFEEVLPKDEISQLLITFIHMSDKVHQREKTLEKKAYHDELTGLRNRVTLGQELDDAIVNASIDKSKAALLFIDINKLKQVNDNIGHEAGDTMIKETANRLTASVRNTDSVYRIGGDEFVILLKDIHDKDDVQLVLETLNANFKKPARIGDSLMPIAISIGVAIAPDDSIDAEELLKYSDIAMYVAKQSTTEQFRYFESNMLIDAPAQYNVS